jgi:hypothetical protein
MITATTPILAELSGPSAGRSRSLSSTAVLTVLLVPNTAFVPLAHRGITSPQQLGHYQPDLLRDKAHSNPIERSGSVQ